MINRGLKLCVILSMLSCGCGYQAYMDRYADSLAEQEYTEELEQLLGPSIDQGGAGFRIRLPKQVSAEPVPANKLPEGINGILQTPANASRPFKVVVAVSRPTDDSPKAMSLKELGFYVFDGTRLDGWMGPGIVASDLTTAERKVPAGPVLKSGQKTVSVQWATIKQSIEPKDEGKPEEYVWKVFFIDQNEMRAMIAYRLRPQDFDAVLTKAIDMSVTQVALVPTVLKNPSGGSGPSSNTTAPRRGD